MAETPKPQLQQQQVQIKADEKELLGQYSNLVVVHHNQEDAPAQKERSPWPKQTSVSWTGRSWTGRRRLTPFYRRLRVPLHDRS